MAEVGTAEKPLPGVVSVAVLPALVAPPWAVWPLVGSGAALLAAGVTGLAYSLSVNASLVAQQTVPPPPTVTYADAQRIKVIYPLSWVTVALHQPSAPGVTSCSYTRSGAPGCSAGAVGQASANASASASRGRVARASSRSCAPSAHSGGPRLTW